MKIAYLASGRPDLDAIIPADSDHVVVAAGPDGQYSAGDLDKIADADAFIVSMEPVHEQILAAAKHLKIVQRMGAGYETLDLEAAARRGIPCCNIEGVNKEAVAEHCMTLILALTKCLFKAESLTRQCQWAEARWLTKQAFELKDKTIGIIGLGNTGSELAKRAKSFEMRVIYNDIRDIDPDLVRSVEATFVEKPELFRSADIVSANTDLNPTSRHMINAETLAMMKPTALLICCARGGVLDEEALWDTLNRGGIAAAGVDVFEKEPIRPDNPLLQAENVILTSHVAGMTEETSQRIFDWAYENVRAVVERGERPRWVRNGV
jgi:phosphoglycerate dehydrogenase-like enzyme